MVNIKECVAKINLTFEPTEKSNNTNIHAFPFNTKTPAFPHLIPKLFDMQTNKIIRTLLIFILIAANVGCDQISKSIVRKSVERSDWIKVYHDNLILTNVENTGAFFGLGSDMPPLLKNILLSLIPSLAILAILFVVLTRRHLPRSAVVGLSFIIGGGIGNIFDRIAYGSVTDFLHMDFGIFKTGIFNMADVSIMVGMGIVLLAMYKKDVEV